MDVRRSGNVSLGGCYYIIGWFRRGHSVRWLACVVAVGWNVRHGQWMKRRSKRYWREDRHLWWNNNIRPTCVGTCPMEDIRWAELSFEEGWWNWVEFEGVTYDVAEGCIVIIVTTRGIHTYFESPDDDLLSVVTRWIRNVFITNLSFRKKGLSRGSWMSIFEISPRTHTETNNVSRR